MHSSIKVKIKKVSFKAYRMQCHWSQTCVNIIAPGHNSVLFVLFLKVYLIEQINSALTLLELLDKAIQPSRS